MAKHSSRKEVWPDVFGGVACCQGQRGPPGEAARSSTVFFSRRISIAGEIYLYTHTIESVLYCARKTVPFGDGVDATIELRCGSL